MCADQICRPEPRRQRQARVARHRRRHRRL